MSLVGNYYCRSSPIEINLSYVSGTYQPNKSAFFGSKDLAKTDWRGRGKESITAQVLIPSDLPMYGTARLNNFPISVRVSENCMNNPITFMSVMAHELSHILLHSLLHIEKDNEIYADLTAMLLGFSEVVKDGRKVTKIIENYDSTETQTTTYGYLSDEQFYCAYHDINRVLREYHLIKRKIEEKNKLLKKKIEKTKRLIFYFKKYISYLDKHLNQKIKPKDGKKIYRFHSPYYIDAFAKVVQDSEKGLIDFKCFFQNSTTYNKGYLQQTTRCIDALDILNLNLSSGFRNLKKEIQLLRRYVSIRLRLKLFFKFFRKDFYKIINTFNFMKPKKLWEAVLRLYSIDSN